jgi:hypothetical protein
MMRILSLCRITIGFQMGVKSKIQQALGRDAPYVEVLPVPVQVARAPNSSDILPMGQLFFDTSTNPPTEYTSLGNGDFTQGGNEEATTSNFGIVQLATLAELQGGTAPAGAYVPTANDVATVIAGVVAGAVPPANESQAGIAEIATQAETDAGTDDTRIVSPLKLATYVAGGSGNGSFVDLTATGTVSFTGATGGYTITSTTASSVGVTGAGIDLTLDSAAGRNVITGGEAAADAVRIQADNAAGGIDVDAGSAGIAIDTTGGISIDSAAASNLTVTGAGADLTLSSVLGSVLVSSTENAALAIRLHANGGTSETIQLHADQGTGVASIGLLSDVGGITLAATGLASNDAINLSAGAGGIDVDAALQINIATSQSAADAIVINASAGGIDITNTGTAGEDIDIASSGASVNISSTENAALAISLNTNGGTSETIRVRNQQGTGAASIELVSTAGGVTLNGGLATTDAINLVAAAGGIDVNAALEINIDSSEAAVADAVRIVASAADGGIDIDSGTGGLTLDTTGAFSIDGAAASNITTTGAGIDLTLSSVLGSVLVSSTEDASLAIRLHANGGTSETIQIHSDQGTGASSVGLLSDVGGITLRSTGLASADAINLEAPAGGIDVDAALQINIASSQAAATAIQLTASDAAGGITLTAGTGAVNVAGNLNLTSVATKMSYNGGAVTDFIGTGTLTNGTVTIANTNIAATDRIFIQRTAANASTLLGELTYTISAGASFTVTALETATPGDTEVGDLSSFVYFIVGQN